MAWRSLTDYTRQHESSGTSTSKWSVNAEALRLDARMLLELGCTVVSHQENSKPLEWLEPVALVVPALRHVHWGYLDMSESSTSAGEKNHWYQFPMLVLVYCTGTCKFRSLTFCSYSDITNKRNDY